MVAAVAGLGMFLAALDISVNVALPSIAKGLDADLQSVQWVIVAFIATRAGLVMGAGSFADRFGLRRVFIFGAVSYLVAMVTISLSPNLESVVGIQGAPGVWRRFVLRGLTGVGGPGVSGGPSGFSHGIRHGQPGAGYVGRDPGRRSC